MISEQKSKSNQKEGSMKQASKNEKMDSKGTSLEDESQCTARQGANDAIMIRAGIGGERQSRIIFDGRREVRGDTRLTDIRQTT